MLVGAAITICNEGSAKRQMRVLQNSNQNVIMLLLMTLCGRTRLFDRHFDIPKNMHIIKALCHSCAAQTYVQFTMVGPKKPPQTFVAFQIEFDNALRLTD
jgi:hypothetical protein